MAFIAIRPGDLVVWLPGSSYPTWPPDGRSSFEERLEINVLKEKTIMFVVAIIDHGSIVIINDRIWWCPVAALNGEPSGSSGLRFV